MVEEKPILPQEPPETPPDSAEKLLESLRQELSKEKPAGRRLFKLPRGLLALSLGGVVLLGLTIFLVVTFLFTNKTTLEIGVEPPGVSLTIDGKRKMEIEKEITLTLKPSDYQLLFQKEGYIDETRALSLEKGQPRSLVVALNPIGSIEESLSGIAPLFPSVSKDGKFFSFYDGREGVFKKWLIEEKKVVPLFDRAFANVEETVWSPDGSAALVKLRGRVALPNMVDNSSLSGAFSPVGERPRPSAPLFGGFSNFLLDNERRVAAGLQPVKLSDGLRGVAFSPAGDQIAYFHLAAAGEKSIGVANRDGGEWRRIIVEGLEGFSNPQLLWSPDAKFLLLYGLTDEKRSRFIVDLTKGTVTQITTGAASLASPRFSPSGELLAYVAGSRLELWEAASGKLIREIELATEQFAWSWKSDSELIVLDEEDLKIVDLEGKKKPIPFIAETKPTLGSELFYARTVRLLLLVYSDKVLSLKL